MVALVEEKRVISRLQLNVLYYQLLEGCDKGRSGALENLKKIRELRNLIDDRARLELKYGSDSPQVLRYDEKVTANELLIRNLAFEIDRGNQLILSNESDLWQVTGFVRGEQLEASPGLIIKIFDEYNVQIIDDALQWVVLTQSAGFFELSVGQNVVYHGDCLSRVIEEGTTLYLRVYTSDGVIPLTDPLANPLIFQFGYVEYTEICGVAVGSFPRDTTFEYGFSSGTTPVVTTRGGVPLGTWTLDGSVTGALDVPPEDLNVELYSTDEEIGNLGTAKVNEDGSFSASIDPRKHPKLFAKKAKVLLKVVDKNKKELYKLRKAMKPKPGKTEKKTIKIKPKKE